MNKEIGMRIGKLVTAATLFTGVGAACGGKSAGEAEVSFVPRAETATVLPTETPTLMPTATVEPTKTPTPEPKKIPSIEDVKLAADMGLASFGSDSANRENYTRFTYAGIAAMGEDDKKSRQAAYNAIGNGARTLTAAACKNPNDTDGPKALSVMKDYTVSMLERDIQRGYFSPGVMVLTTAQWDVPANCQNPNMTQAASGK